MAEDTRKNILEVDVVQSIDKTDTVLVNDSGSLCRERYIKPVLRIK